LRWRFVGLELTNPHQRLFGTVGGSNRRLCGRRWRSVGLYVTDPQRTHRVARGLIDEPLATWEPSVVVGRVARRSSSTKPSPLADAGREALSRLTGGRAAWLPPPRRAAWPGGRGAGCARPPGRRNCEACPVANPGNLPGCRETVAPMGASRGGGCLSEKPPLQGRKHPNGSGTPARRARSPPGRTSAIHRHPRLEVAGVGDGSGRSASTSWPTSASRRRQPYPPDHPTPTSAPSATDKPPRRVG
jgi:hypothetical protein